MAVRSDCNLIIRRRWSVEDSEDKVCSGRARVALGIRRTCEMMTADDDNASYGGSGARVNDCDNCVGSDKRVLNMEGSGMSSGEGIEKLLA